ncbi:MAG: hypothetical protein DRG82_15320 [Deltaproteobacteria bacterium]|nr:MAG: hypothetical protein DRG82_15320 [Deltaproteobacteria bacterium]
MHASFFRIFQNTLYFYNYLNMRSLSNGLISASFLSHDSMKNYFLFSEKFFSYYVKFIFRIHAAYGGNH